MPSTPPVRLALLLAALALLAGCTSMAEPWIAPEITPLGFRPGQISAEQQTFIVSLEVKNPNDRTLPIKGATYNMEVEGYEVAAGSGSLDKQIAAFDTGVVDVAVNTNLMRLIREVPALAFSDDRWSYRISGILQLAGGFIPVPYRYSGEVEASQIIGRLGR